MPYERRDVQESVPGPTCLVNILCRLTIIHIPTWRLVRKETRNLLISHQYLNFIFKRNLTELREGERRHLVVRSSRHFCRCISPAATMTCSPVSWTRTWTHASAWLSSLSPASSAPMSPATQRMSYSLHTLQHGERLSDVFSGYRGMLTVICYH